MIVLIPLRAQQEYTELRYCLRSIDRYIKPTEVVLAGDHIPTWVNNVTVLAVPDHPGRKQFNIRRKILAGLHYTRKEILFLSDDVYLLKPYIRVYYSSGLITKRGEGGSVPLAQKLQELAKPCKDYDVHCPIIYVQDFIQVMENFETACIIKSAYGNYLELPSVDMWDCKFDRKIEPEKIKQLIAGRPYFSTSPGGIGYVFPVLQELFPEKSRYEL